MYSKSVRERRAIIAGIAGNVMEWYDFGVYGYFAANITSSRRKTRSPR
jgi:hypothetical protein